MWLSPVWVGRGHSLNVFFLYGAHFAQGVTLLVNLMWCWNKVFRSWIIQRDTTMLIFSVWIKDTEIKLIKCLIWFTVMIMITDCRGWSCRWWAALSLCTDSRINWPEDFLAGVKDTTWFQAWENIFLFVWGMVWNTKTQWWRSSEQRQKVSV